MRDTPDPLAPRTRYSEPPRYRNHRKIHITLSLENIGYLHSEATRNQCSISQIANAVLTDFRKNQRTGADPEAGTDDDRR